MKVVLVTPNFHQPRGNTVTVQRISDNLEKKGVETEIVSMTEDGDVEKLPDADLVHGFHAYKFLKFKEKLKTKVDSYVLSITGTDLNHDLFDHNRRNDVVRSLSEAKAIHVFDESAKQMLQTEVEGLEDKIYVIAQGTTQFTEEKIELKKEQGTLVFLLPAGVRKVKNIPFAIEALEKLQTKIPSIRLWIVGPILEKEEGKVVEELADKHHTWVKYLGPFPHSDMGALYQISDIVLNTSHSEGQPAAILEAMGHGLPVLVSSNHGNLSIVSHEENGMVYSTEAQFLDFAERLVNNNELRAKIGKNAEIYIDSNHSATYEAERFITIYKNALKSSNN
ncbi:glycosyltransferase family 4 protein [Litchfieldia alkalitelluris]|uniref:glycosyltransferase family 4 protein n=1 Tax=Litchfieldia alkalitelluris TaxID=304268 RepID=UPI001956F5B6|nr:glycosyltransferase family 4 protein [Litchfieldia alkalitelluris]